MNKLNKISSSVADYDIQLHHVHIHNYGNHKELTCHIMLPAEMTLKEASIIADKVETQIFNELKMTATIKKETIN